MQFLKGLKQTEGVFLLKKNDLHPFEDTEKMVFLTEKNNTPMFVFGNHSKKKQDHLVFGRIFDSQVLDMFEFKITNVRGDYQKALNEVDKVQRPVFLCMGIEFELNEELQRMRSFFQDLLYKRMQKEELVDLN